MTAENFVYWLNGFMEIANPEVITTKQIEEIRNHIKLVLDKQTPGTVRYTGGSGVIPGFPGVSWGSGPPGSC